MDLTPLVQPPSSVSLSGNHHDKSATVQTPAELQEVPTVEECDVILAFCPVGSVPSTDTKNALQQLNDLSGSKPAVLVVLHHTFDPELIVPDSSRSVNREKTLAVDCLFHEDKGLLHCGKNVEALSRVSEWIETQGSFHRKP
ncbi:hypothetical protein AOLI_G00270210 [Acnodon oligacanthus]